MTDPNQPPSSPPPAYSPSPSAPPSAPPYASGPSTSPPAPYGAAPSYSGGPGAPAGPVPGRTLGIVALAGSILVGFLSLVWLILGIVALVKSRRAGRGNGFAIAAIIISALALVIGVIAVGFAIYWGVTMAQLCAEYGPGTYEVNGNPVELTCG